MIQSSNASAAITRTCERLFVYGSLRSEMSNEVALLLRSKAVLVGRARVKAKLYAIVKCDPSIGNDGAVKRSELFGVSLYPGLVPSNDDSDWVIGEVYDLTNLTELLAFLDAYEGCGQEGLVRAEFERAIYPAVIDSGIELFAFVYVYRGDTSLQQPILSGDYVQYLADRGRRTG